MHVLCNIILIKTGQHKTRTAVVRLHLLRSPRFIPESVFYTKSVMLSPRFMTHTVFYTQSVVRVLYLCSCCVPNPQSAVRSPQSAVRRPQSAGRSHQYMFYTDRVNRHQPCLFRRYARRRAFITKTRTTILFTNTTLNRLGFGVTATGHFHFRNNETGDMLV